MRIAGNIGLALMTSGAIVMLTAGGLIALPPLESGLLPVAKDFKFFVTDKKPDRMTVEWWATKVRSCKVEGSAVVVRREGEWVGAYLSPADDGDNSPLLYRTRPLGYQRFQRVDIFPSGDAIAMDLRHDCHPGWSTVTHVPPTLLPWPPESAVSSNLKTQ